MSDTTTLGLMVQNDGFRFDLVSCVREKAERSRSAIGESGKNAAALETLANSLEGRRITDQSLTALYLIGQEQGHDGSYMPGPKQSELFARLGDGMATVPEPDDTLSELVAAAVLDLIEFQNQKRAGTEQERDVATNEAAELKRRRPGVASLSANFERPASGSTV